MASSDPRQAVIEAITAPPGRRVPAGASPGGWQAFKVEGGPYSSARPDSIAFLKERAGSTHRLYAVSYVDTEGLQHLDFHGVAQGADGSWTLCGGAGGSGSGPVRERPWVNFGGWRGAELFCAGGRIIGVGAELARQVELDFGEEASFSDTVDDGLVLFLAEETLPGPAVARIFDSGGKLLAKHPALCLQLSWAERGAPFCSDQRHPPDAILSAQ